MLGGGIAGLLAGAYLKKAGVDDVRVIEMGGDFGGVWYWNRFPGIQCDNDAYCYIPLLEELDFVPTQEVRRRCRDLSSTAATSASISGCTTARSSPPRCATVRWDDSIKRWRLSTNRGDDIRARFVVMTQGSYNRPKLPGIPGITDFKGHIVPLGALGLRLHRRGRQRRTAQAARQARRARRHRCDRRAAGSASRPRRPAPVCVSAHAVIGGRAWQRADRSAVGGFPAARLAGGTQAQLSPLVTVRGRCGVRRSRIWSATSGPSWAAT